jgi:cell division protein ZapB
MEAELAALEDRIKTLAMLCQQLRNENGDLRQQVQQLRGENKRLEEKLVGAKTRIQTLIDQLPAEDEA